jgi:hypothetical protein
VVHLEGGESAGLWGEVALEVRRTAYLRGVRFQKEGSCVQVAGEVVGESEGPLDLYLIWGRRTAAYAAVTPTAQGAPFALRGEAGQEESESAGKVDLVGGAVVWYTVEQTPVGEQDGAATKR